MLNGNTLGIRGAIASNSAGLYAPWISGDTLTTVYIGSSNSSNNQTALTVQSYSSNGIDAKSNTGTGVLAESETGNALIASNNAAASTTTIADVLIIRSNAAGGVTPAAGFGAEIKFQLQSSTTASRNAATIATLWSTATDASRASYVSISSLANAVMTEYARFGNSTTSSFVNDIYGSTVIAGNQISAGDIDLGAGGSGSRNAIFDMHADDTWTDYALRLARTAGTNATGGLYQRGTGALQLETVDLAGIEFYTNSVLRSTIDSTGHWGYGGAPVSTVALALYGTDATTSNYAFICRNSTPLDLMRIRNDGGAGAFYINGAAWTFNSDARVKSRIDDLDYGLLDLLNLRPRRMDYTDGPKNVLGFVAQELQEQMPDLVEEGPDGMLGIRTTDLIPVLVNAVRELSERIQFLESQL